MRSVVEPPIPLSTFNEMVKDHRVPPPDGTSAVIRCGRTRGRERFKQDLLSGMRSRRKGDAKATTAEAR